MANRFCRLATLFSKYRSAWSGAVEAEEQIAQGAPAQDGDPKAVAVFGPVMRQVTAPAQGDEVAPPVVGRIVVAVTGSKHDTACPVLRVLDNVRPGRRLAGAVDPDARRGIVPAAVRQAPHSFAVRALALLAMSSGPPEADLAAELNPVNRVEPAHLGSDRHGEVRSEDRENPFRPWLPGVLRDGSSCGRMKAAARV